MWQIKARLLYNKKIKGHYFRCGFAAPLIAKKINPGQFVNIRLRDAFDPLLRRPFSIHRLSSARIEILYAVIGKGTEALTQRKPGEYLDVIGPLGNGFNYRLPFTVYRLPILVAGGMGVAPLLFLAERLAKSKEQRAKSRILVLIGAETKNYILCAKEFRELGCEVKIATDDGSRGFKGKVTDLLKSILPKAYSHKPLAIYACGPHPMLQEISLISKQHNIPAQISLEEHLACGFGACLGCAVNTNDGYQRVCKEGPVFDADEIIW